MEFKESVLQSIEEANKKGLTVMFAGDAEKISITVSGKSIGIRTEEVSKDIKYNVGEGAYNDAVSRRIDLMVKRTMSKVYEIYYGGICGGMSMHTQYATHAEGTWGKATKK